ncbi:MAG: pilus assembly protein [Lachnospiraceae bacterium]|nr:pilus assembly protein [Lachnospiraceae bacterium]
MRRGTRRERHLSEVALRGSFTVEAVFVVPMITMIIILMIDMALYLRDYSVAHTLAERIAEDTRALVLNDEEPTLHKVMYERKLSGSIVRRWFRNTDAEDEETMEQYLEELCQGRFWICRIDGKSVRIGEGKVSVTMKLKTDTAMPFIGKALTTHWFSDEITCEMPCEDVGLRTRIYAAVIETGMQIKGVGTVLEKLSEIVNRLR